MKSISDEIIIILIKKYLLNLYNFSYFQFLSNMH